MIYIAAILGITTIYSTAKWISYFYGLAGMIHYMEENDMKTPTNQEIEKAIAWAFTNSINSLKLKLKIKKLS